MLSLEKQKTVAKRIPLLRYVPFVRLAVLSGSCATGEAKDDSDIDLVIAAEDGRVWLCRALTLLFCDLLGVRNKPLPREASAKLGPRHSGKDKLCLSHFVGLSELKINDPENSYEEESYPHLLPVYGAPAVCDEFLKSNDHIIKTAPDYLKSPLYVKTGGKISAKFTEKLYSGVMGDLLELRAKNIQLKKIRRHAETITGKTRIITAPNRIETYYSIY